MGCIRMIDSDWAKLSTSDRQKVLHSFVEENAQFGGAWAVSQLGEETDPICRWYLLKSLGYPAQPAGVPALLEAGRLPDQQVGVSSLHMIAAWALGQIGEIALESVKKELSIVQSETFRTFLVDCLGEIGAPNAIPELAAAFEDGSYQTRLWAALSLAKIGPSALPHLLLLLRRSRGDEDRMILIDAYARLSGLISLDAANEFEGELSSQETVFLLDRKAKIVGSVLK